MCVCVSLCSYVHVYLQSVEYYLFMTRMTSCSVILVFASAILSRAPYTKSFIEISYSRLSLNHIKKAHQLCSQTNICIQVLFYFWIVSFDEKGTKDTLKVKTSLTLTLPAARLYLFVLYVFCVVSSENQCQILGHTNICI